MRRVVSRRLFPTILAPFTFRQVHTPSPVSTHENSPRDVDVGATTKSDIPQAKLKPSLSPLSASVRGLFQRSGANWSTQPGTTATLLTLLSTHSHSTSGNHNTGQSDSNKSAGTLHPLLALECLCGLGYAVWGPSAWAIRSGLHGDALRDAAESIIGPLLPIAQSHARVLPHCHILVEWIVCLSDIPLAVWLPLLKTCAKEKADPKRPPPEFLLEQLVPQLPLRGADFEERFEAVDSLLRRIPIGRKGEGDEEKVVDCLFWRGQHPLLHSSAEVRASYWRIVKSQKEDKLNTRKEEEYDEEERRMPTGAIRLALSIKDDDVFRRMLLRLMTASSTEVAFSAETAKQKKKVISTVHAMEDGKMGNGEVEQGEVILEDIVLVEPRLCFTDLSLALRLIVPLAEFMTTPKNPSAPLRLSIASVRHVLTDAVEELQRLRKGDDAAAQRYALLPHKPRIHALRDLCSRVLRQAEDYFYGVNDVNKKDNNNIDNNDNNKHLEAITENSTHDNNNNYHNSGIGGDILLPSDIAALRALAGISRRLVAAVMSEKRESLLSEGAEGAALHAGGATPSDMTAVLRNTAYRVLEPSLMRYYTAVDAEPCFHKLSVLKASLSQHANDKRNDYTNGRQDMHGLCREDNPVAAALAALSHHVSGRAALVTAQHLLRHPLRQDAIAVAEGLRLVALQSLLLHDTHCEEWLRAGLATTISHAFFGVWHRQATESALDQSACQRLLWTVLLMHQRYCPICTTGAGDCQLLNSLRGILTEDGAHTEFATFGWQDHVEDSAIPLVYPKLSAVRWELAEELAAKGKQWQWLGSTHMVHEIASKIRQDYYHNSLSLGEEQTHISSPAPTGPPVLLLLPWSTVAQSRHPLRLYDESGQSATAAAAFDADLDFLLRCDSSTHENSTSHTITPSTNVGNTIGTANSHSNNTNTDVIGGDQHGEAVRGKTGESGSMTGTGVLVRLLSPAEECTCFSHMDSTMELRLGRSAVTVINAEVPPPPSRGDEPMAPFREWESDLDDDLD